MKVTRRTARLSRAFAAMAAASLCAGCEFPRWTQSADARPGGPDWANLSLNNMVDKYGPPDRIEIARVVWIGKGPWKRIAVWDDMGLGQLTAAKDENLEVTLAYAVPAGRLHALEEYDGRLKVSEDGSEISARAFSEERDFLALNLADEIIRGAKTPQEARDFASATLRLADAGKSSPYMKSLLFRPPAAASLPPASALPAEAR
jgi:hypothetical protein